MWRELTNFRLENVPEVIVLALLIFLLLTVLRGTRGEGMLKILGGVLAIAYITLRTLALEYPGGELKRLIMVLDAIFQASVIALVVIFQPELRRGLALKIPRFFAGEVPDREVVEEVATAAAKLSKAKIGALIAIEREDSLKEYVASGTVTDAEVRAELLRTIFYVGTPLHDGAVIIQKGRLAAAGCFLPLTDNPAVPKSLGTRHRAGIGLSEAEDAMVVIVSEETGTISFAEGGRLHRELDREALVAMLEQHYLMPPEEPPPAAEQAALEEPGPTIDPSSQRPVIPPAKVTTRIVRRKVTQ